MKFQPPFLMVKDHTPLKVRRTPALSIISFEALSGNITSMALKAGDPPFTSPPSSSSKPPRRPALSNGLRQVGEFFFRRGNATGFSDTRFALLKYIRVIFWANSFRNPVIVMFEHFSCPRSNHPSNHHCPISQPLFSSSTYFVALSSPRPSLRLSSIESFTKQDTTEGGKSDTDE